MLVPRMEQSRGLTGTKNFINAGQHSHRTKSKAQEQRSRRGKGAQLSVVPLGEAMQLESAKWRRIEEASLSLGKLERGRTLYIRGKVIWVLAE